MTFTKLIAITGILCIVSSCKKRQFAVDSDNVAVDRSNFPNILNVAFSVNQKRNLPPTLFSDLGAWHAYTLPKKKEDMGSFPGPLLMDMEGKWLSKSIARFYINEDGNMVDLSSSNIKQKLHYYPGLLHQYYESSELIVHLYLLFTSHREALLQTVIQNKKNTPKNIELKWTGTLLNNTDHLRADKNKTHISDSDKHHFLIQYHQAVTLTTNDTSYTATKSIILREKETKQFSQTHAFFLNPEELRLPGKKSFKTELKRNTLRWNKYINNYVKENPEITTDKKQLRLAVKSIVTLITNWRSKAKDLLHDGVFPSVTYQGFYGFWSWDSWKHAVALVDFHPELAKSSVRSMFDYQDKNGMIPDCIFTDKNSNNQRNTKSPLATWAVYHIYKVNKDIGFVKEMFPKLLRYHRWWYKDRDYDNNGLCEYGSTDGTLTAARWESMDNAVRYDRSKLHKSHKNAWSMDQESVDINAYLYREKKLLSILAEILSQKQTAEVLQKEADRLKKQMQCMYDEETRFFYDKKISSTKLIKIHGPEGWIPLWAKLADSTQAKNIAATMRHKTLFNTKVPLPTLSANHPKFNPKNGYWRGPVWLDQFYFAIKGLKNYGYDKIADKMTYKLLQNAEGLSTDMPLRENYHPLTGEGLNATNFSWTAAHLLLLLKELHR